MRTSRDGIDTMTGGFRALVTGDVARVLQGRAGLFRNEPQDGGGVYAHLEDASGRVAIDLIHLAGSPPMGVRPIGNLHGGEPDGEDWVALLSTSEKGRLTAVYLSATGEVVMQPSANGVDCRFAFAAVCRPEAGGVERRITVAGDFHARWTSVRLPFTAGRLSWDWDLSGIGLSEADLGLGDRYPER
jgi:hypothetical protein